MALLGSARGDGYTSELLRALLSRLPGAGLVDLGAHKIAPYNYEERYGDDDFGAIIEAVMPADTLIFASPVYWYSMSTPMKAFFDRLTDLTASRKSQGKALAGKAAFLVATGGAPKAPGAFEPPFADTARYFRMGWGGMLYQQRNRALKIAIDGFAARIKSTTTESEVVHV